MQRHVDSILPTDDVPIWEAEDNVEGLARPFAIGLAGYRCVTPAHTIDGRPVGATAARSAACELLHTSHICIIGFGKYAEFCHSLCP